MGFQFPYILEGNAERRKNNMLVKFCFKAVMQIIAMLASILYYIKISLNLFFPLHSIQKFIFQLIERCWTTDSTLRPFPKDVLKCLERIDPDHGETMEKLVLMVDNIKSFLHFENILVLECCIQYFYIIFSFKPSIPELWWNFLV